VAAAKNIKTVAAEIHNRKGDKMLEFDEFKFELDKYKGALAELGESL
jgi:hypothetical protein